MNVGSRPCAHLVYVVTGLRWEGTVPSPWSTAVTVCLSAAHGASEEPCPCSGGFGAAGPALRLSESSPASFRALPLSYSLCVGASELLSGHSGGRVYGPCARVSLPHPARLPAEPTRAGVLLLKVPFALSRGRSRTPGGHQQRVETVLVVATETGIALGI